MRSVNPATGELIKEYEPHDATEVEVRLAMAEQAFVEWSREPLDVRLGALRALAAELRKEVELLAGVMTAEMGKPIVEARAEVEKCAWVCDYYAEHAPEFLAPQDAPSAAQRSFVRFDPLGPVLAIMPWNFPLWQVFRFAAPALAAGNVLLVKHAPNSLACSVAIEGLALTAGLPPGVVQDLRVEVDRVADVIAHPTIRAVTLTGSDRAGRAVAAAAGASLKKCVLELGGSDPFIVLPDADLDAALSAAVVSRTLNGGQSCIAAKRFFVHRDIAEDFVAQLCQRFEALRVGDPADPETQVGPLARPDLRDALHEQVTRSVAAGASVRTGGSPGHGECFYPPTVLTGVEPGMPAFDEETFGPVAAVTAVDSLDHALELANSSRFGLGASLWTADRQLAEAVAPRVEAGCLFVNHMTVSDPRLPFGGVKDSGYGRELGLFGLREFVNVKSVWID